MLDRSVAPSFVIPEEFIIPVPKKTTFSNGVVCHYLGTGDQPIVKLELHFEGGKKYDNSSYSSFLMAKLLTQGTKTKSAEEIAEFIAFYGAYLEITSGNEKVIVTLYTISKHLEPLSHFLQEIIFESVFNSDDLKRVKEIEIQNLHINQSKTSYLATESFRDHLFPSHYYGSSISESKLELINVSDLRAFHSSYILGKKMEIFVSGKVSQEDLKVIEENFGSYSCTPVVENIGSKLITSNKGLKIIKKESSTQASIRFGFRTIGKTDPDYFKLSICNEILGGYFGSRLMSNIREDKGYTYGIGSYLVQLKYASFFQISTDVKSEFANATIDEIKKEIDILCTQTIATEELTKVKNYLFGSFASSLNTSFDLMDKYKTIHSLGLTYEFYDRYFEILKSISSDEIRKISNQYLSSEPLVVVCS